MQDISHTAPGHRHPILALLDHVRSAAHSHVVRHRFPFRVTHKAPAHHRPTVLQALLNGDVAFLCQDPARLRVFFRDTSLLPLHAAASAGNARLVRVLLDAGARANETGDGGNTALHFACIAGQLDAARALLDGGADPNAANIVETRPLHDVARFGGNSQTQVGLLLLLVDRGARTCETNVYGNTPAHRAVLHGRLTFLAALSLLETKALDVETHRGYTALDLAYARKDPVLIETLKSFGAAHGSGWGGKQTFASEDTREDLSWEALEGFRGNYARMRGSEGLPLTQISDSH